MKRIWWVVVVQSVARSISEYIKRSDMRCTGSFQEMQICLKAGRWCDRQTNVRAARRMLLWCERLTLLRGGNAGFESRTTNLEHTCERHKILEERKCSGWQQDCDRQLLHVCFKKKREILLTRKECLPSCVLWQILAKNQERQPLLVMSLRAKRKTFSIYEHCIKNVKRCQSLFATDFTVTDLMKKIIDAGYPKDITNCSKRSGTLEG